jgi:tetratricopeptide (TPR) repeat protein
MSPNRIIRRATITLCALLFVGLNSPHALAQASKLGAVEFPTSTASKEAQEHFVRGVAALHSFWYEEARDEFRQASRLDPDFMLAYWGEAMTFNHPLWAEQDTDAARAVVKKFRDLPKLTPRERAFLGAVRLLYGDGDKPARDMAYSDAMSKLYRDNPDDLEAASFYALSLLGTVRPGDSGFARQMRAGAIALDVYQKNPEHPGAAHYIIHAFDDPEHAILALPAARRYAEIAPAAHHARHMPAHIFLQLGMWDEAAASNESAWKTSTEWVERKKLALGLRDYHSLHWLTYVYLQQGRFDEAEKLLALKERDMAASNYDPLVSRAYAESAAAFVVETERWDRAPALLATLDKTSKTASSSYAAAPTDSCHAGATAAAAPAPKTMLSARDDAVGRMAPLHFRGLVAAYTKDAATAERIVTELRAMRASFAGRPLGKRIEIKELEIGAILNASQGKYDEAVEMMQRATKLEEELSPPSGPPDFIKPPHELLGEILLRAKRPKEASAQFAVALSRQPNRARSLLGAARAAKESGDQVGAVNAYNALLKIWTRADSQLAEVREARSFVEQAAQR